MTSLRESQRRGRGAWATMNALFVMLRHISTGFRAQVYPSVVDLRGDDTTERSRLQRWCRTRRPWCETDTLEGIHQDVGIGDDVHFVELFIRFWVFCLHDLGDNCFVSLCYGLLSNCSFHKLCSRVNEAYRCNTPNTLCLDSLNTLGVGNLRINWATQGMYMNSRMSSTERWNAWMTKCCSPPFSAPKSSPKDSAPAILH